MKLRRLDITLRKRVPNMYQQLLFALLTLSTPAYCWDFLETDELYIEYHRLNPGNRDPYAPQYTGKWRERANLVWDSTLVRKKQYRLFWNHQIHTETIDSGAVKTVGWEWKSGISFGRYVDVFHYHHSRHIMDERVEHPYYGNKSNQFPVEDSFVLRFKFITEGR
jgi:hypothetical protein